MSVCASSPHGRPERALGELELREPAEQSSSVSEFGNRSADLWSVPSDPEFHADPMLKVLDYTNRDAILWNSYAFLGQCLSLL